MPPITYKFSDIIVYNSITNNLDDQKYDIGQAFTFLEFLNYSKSLDKTLIEFSDYENYLAKWNISTNNLIANVPNQVRQQFVELLKTITINYTTNEEKRFISNIDFTNQSDLEIAVPFFSKKIKQILLYFAQKRDTYKIDLLLAKNKGSIDGIQNYLKTYIIETLFAEDNPPFGVLYTPLSAITTQIDIEVEEGYDTFNNYFDLDPFKPASFYDAKDERASYFTSNTNIDDPNLFLNFDKAIVNLINSEQVTLSSLPALAVNISSPDVTLLQPYDFIDYTTVTRENVKLILNAELISKFTGTDFYYLSTGSDVTNLSATLSGNLFSVTSPYSNLLNVYNASTLTVPSTSTVYERDMGLFFKPTKRSIIQLQTPFSYYINKNLEPNHVYIFPDPNSYGNVSGLTKTDHETPLSFNLQGEKIQKNISSNNAYGNTNVSDNDFTFESYHSEEQQYKFKSYAEAFYNAGILSQYTSDIYGNVILGFKQNTSSYLNSIAGTLGLNATEMGLSAFTQTLYLSSIVSLLSGDLNNTQTLFSSPPFRVTIPTIFDIRNSAGLFYIYNIGTDNLNPLSAELNDVLQKYPLQYYGLTRGLQNIEIINDTFVFTTSSFVIIDKVVYKNNQFYKSPNVPLILQRAVNNEITNPFLIDNNLYLFNYSLLQNPALSGNNTRPFGLSLYTYNLNNNTYTVSSSTNTFTYNVNTKLDVYTIKMAYNKKYDIFNIVANVKDGNQNFFLHNIKGRIIANNFNVISDRLFTPNNNNLTVNFFDLSNVETLSLNPVITTPTINTNGTVTF